MRGWGWSWGGGGETHRDCALDVASIDQQSRCPIYFIKQELNENSVFLQSGQTNVAFV